MPQGVRIDAHLFIISYIQLFINSIVFRIKVFCIDLSAYNKYRIDNR